MQNKPEETHRKRDSKGAEVHKRGLHAQSSLTLCDPMDCSPPGSSVHGILQAKYWSGLLFPLPGDRPNPGMEPGSPGLQLWQEGSLPLCRPLGSCTGGIFSCKTCGVLKGCHVASLGPHITVCLNVQASVFLILQVLSP